MVILYSLLILSISVGVLTKIEFLPSANIYLYDVISLFIVLVKVKTIVSSVKVNFKKISLLLLFLVCSSLSIPFHVKTNTEFIVSFSYLIRITLYLLLLIPLLSIPQREILKIKISMLFSGILFIMFGYIQYLYYPNLRNLYYLGWDEHLYRLFSTFLDPNFAGLFIVLVFFLYIDLLTSVFKKSNTILKSVLILGFLYILPSLFLTYSRSSFVAFFVGMFSLLFLLRKKKFILAFILLFLAALAILPKNFGGEGVNLFRTASLIARSGEYSKAWEIFLKNPLFGVGFNTLRYVSQEYGYVSHADSSSHAASGVPNSYLYILATSGILGTTLFFLLLFKLVKSLFLKVNNRKVSTVCCLCSLIVVAVGSLFENFLFYAPIMIWVIVLTGVEYNKYVYSKKMFKV